MATSHWTDEEKIRLRTIYPDRTRSLGQVANELGRSVAATKQMARQLGVQRPRGGMVDETVFHRDTPETAYWAGFLMADGCVQGHMLSLGLSQEDAGQVDAFLSFIACSSKVCYSKGISASTSIKSSPLIESLRRWGVVQRKTYIGSIPNDIPQVLLPHYLRGLIDGDGGIYIYRRGRTGITWTVNLCNNSMVIEQAKIIIQTQVGISPHDYTTKRKTDHVTKVLSVTRKRDVLQLLEWLDYTGDGPSLPRKREKALEILGTDPRMIDMRCQRSQ